MRERLYPSVEIRLAGPRHWFGVQRWFWRARGSNHWSERVGWTWDRDRAERRARAAIALMEAERRRFESAVFRIGPDDLDA